MKTRTLKVWISSNFSPSHVSKFGIFNNVGFNLEAEFETIVTYWFDAGDVTRPEGESSLHVKFNI